MRLISHQTERAAFCHLTFQVSLRRFEIFDVSLPRKIYHSESSLALFKRDSVVKLARHDALGISLSSRRQGHRTERQSDENKPNIRHRCHLDLPSKTAQRRSKGFPSRLVRVVMSNDIISRADSWTRQRSSSHRHAHFNKQPPISNPDSLSRAA